MELPTFSGKVEEYWEWREVFRALVTDDIMSPPLYIHQLKIHLKGDAKEMLQGVTRVEDAWEVLDMYFGDTTAAIATITAKLRHLKPGGAPHEKLEGVARGVQQAITSLHQVGAEAMLAADFGLIGCLVEKLAPAQAERWDEHVGQSGAAVSWDMFVSWLGEARRTAHATKVRKLGNTLAAGQGLGAAAVTLSSREQEEWRPEGEAAFYTDPKVTETRRLAAEKKTPSCPGCKLEGIQVKHTFTKDFPRWPTPGSIQWPSHRMSSCPRFIKMSVAERASLVLKLEVCLKCGGFNHNTDTCRLGRPTCKIKDTAGKVCGAHHITELHGSGSPAVQVLGVCLACPALAAAAMDRPVCTFLGSPALLALHRVPVADREVSTLLLCDEGAQINLIRHDTAKKIAVGEPVPWTLNLQVVGDVFRPTETFLYNVFLLDSEGNKRGLVAAGVERISTAGPCPNLEAVRSIFPEVKDSTLQRPHGEVDLLIGASDASMLPFGGLRVGDLRLEKCPWGEGEVLRGSVPGLRLPATAQLTPKALATSRAVFHRSEGGVEYGGQGHGWQLTPSSSSLICWMKEGQRLPFLPSGKVRNWGRGPGPPAEHIRTAPGAGTR